MAAKSYLFAVTHWLLTAGAILMILFTALMVLGEGALFVGLLNLDGNHLDIPDMVHGVSRNTIFALGIPAVAALMVGALVFALIFQLTAKIVETTILGDPFVSENATRLTRIGWLLVGLQVGSWCIHLALTLLPERLQDNIQFDSDFSPVGLLAILLVFVLAQVFRRGSEMRDELEATV